MDHEGLKVNFFQGSPFVGASVKMKPGPPIGGSRGEFIAWDAVAGKKVWGISERFPVVSGALATAGNLVFYGTLDRQFKAVNATTGQVVFQTQLESGIIGNPMTFVGADGKQRTRDLLRGGQAGPEASACPSTIPTAGSASLARCRISRCSHLPADRCTCSGSSSSTDRRLHDSSRDTDALDLRVDARDRPVGLIHGSRRRTSGRVLRCAPTPTTSRSRTNTRKGSKTGSPI
jgi:hypothetical protein